MNFRLQSIQRLLFVTTVMASALFFSSMSLAQNACSQVLMALSAAGASGAIHSLAQMKFDIDQGLTQGASGSFKIKTLAQQYPERLTAVAKQMGISEAELKSRIVVEIAKLQNTKPEEAPRISKNELLRSVIDSALPLYTKGAQINLSHALDKVSRRPGVKKLLSLNDKIIVLANEDGSVIIVDRTTNQIHQLEGNVSEARVSSDGKSILVLNSARIFVRYDINDLSVQQKVQLDPKKFPRDERDFHKIDISPDLQTLAVGTLEGKVMLFDLSTGMHFDFTKNDRLGGDKITSVRFIDNDNIVFDSPWGVYVYNIRTVTPRIIPFIDRDSIISMGVSADKSVATIVRMDQAISIDLKKFQIINIENMFSENTSQQVFKEIPNDVMGHFAIMTPLQTMGPRIFNPRDLKEVVFDFEGRYDSKTVKTLDILFSPSKEKVDLLFIEDNNYFIEEWQLIQ